MIRSVAALIAAQVCVQLTGGLLGVWMPLVMIDHGFTEFSIGLIAAAYAVGFMAGSWISPRALALLGHIRTYAATAALACALTLVLHALYDPWSWAVSRLLMGVVLALMFTAAESWINGVTPREQRGGVIGFYMLCTKLALAAGPFLVMGADPSAAGPFMIAGAAFALALVPIALTQQTQPSAPAAAPLDIPSVVRLAPAAAFAALIAGIANSAVLALAPLYAVDRGGEGAAAGFMAAAWIGSLATQWFAGRLSDRIDRRLVIAGLTGLAAVTAGGLALAPQDTPFALISIIFGAWAAGALSYYGIAVAHLADRSRADEMAAATASLLFIWAAGSVVGPPLAGLLIEFVTGPDGLFAFAAVAFGILAPAMLWRRAARAAPAAEAKTKAEPAQANSILSGRMGTDET